MFGLEENHLYIVSCFGVYLFIGGTIWYHELFKSSSSSSSYADSIEPPDSLLPSISIFYHSWKVV